ncbi:hypothetical protein [Streptomyces spirodelae]|uniref:hypothetical protein n=1 Tax=Streptomyces spirodelae TaxID=2812904 RepID=UPI0027DC471A|nr:hypothetical protein [Streptomyces spirodelae]
MPLEFTLPHGWQPAAPEQVGAPDVAFVALHPQPDAGFTANITIDGAYRSDTASLADLAEASYHRMQELAETVTVTSRNEVGSGEAPGLTQQLVFSAVTDGRRRQLVQTQVYLSMPDSEDLRKRAVIQLAVTATVTQYESVAGDFGALVRTVQPSSAASS